MKNALENMALKDRIIRAVFVSELDLDWSYGALDNDNVIVRDNRRNLEHCVSRFRSWDNPDAFIYEIDTFRVGESDSIHRGAYFKENARFFDVFKYLLTGGNA